MLKYKRGCMIFTFGLVILIAFCIGAIFFISRLSLGSLDITYNGDISGSYSVHGTGSISCSDSTVIGFNGNDESTYLVVSIQGRVKTNQKYYFTNDNQGLVEFTITLIHNDNVYRYSDLESGFIKFDKLPRRNASDGNVSGTFSVVFSDIAIEGKFSFYVELEYPASC